MEWTSFLTAKLHQGGVLWGLKGKADVLVRRNASRTRLFTAKESEGFAAPRFGGGIQNEGPRRECGLESIRSKGLALTTSG